MHVRTAGLLPSAHMRMSLLPTQNIPATLHSGATMMKTTVLLCFLWAPCGSEHSVQQGWNDRETSAPNPWAPLSCRDTRGTAERAPRSTCSPHGQWSPDHGHRVGVRAPHVLSDTVSSKGLTESHRSLGIIRKACGWRARYSWKTA